MSAKIDERVVGMKIDHQQFLKGTQESIDALSNLKRALKFDNLSKETASLDGMKKALKFEDMSKDLAAIEATKKKTFNFDDEKRQLGELSGAARRVSLAGISDGIDEIAAKFTGLQAIALGALANIGFKAVNVGESMIRSLTAGVTEGMRSGFADYNTKLTSVQTIMNATGADIETVNGYFKTLDTYADKTVYNLQDMTGAFAKFTNAGVAMDVSVPAIQGIANMVALAGQGANEASIAMYNLSQSIGGGFLTTTDYKSLNLANVATKEWKDQMIAGAVAAGTLRDEGGGVYTILSDGSEKAATAQSLFTEELSKGWASTSVLLSVLGDYGDLTTDIGKKAFAAAQNVKSIPMMFETLSAMEGTGWTETFELLLGNVTESTKLFTFLTGEVGAFMAAASDARNSQVKMWVDAGGRAALFGEGVGALENIFAALHSVINPIVDAFNDIFSPKFGNIAADISKAIQSFTKGLILNDEAQANLKMVAKGLFIVLKFGIDIVMGVVKVAGWLIGMVFDLAGALGTVITPIMNFIRGLLPVKDSADETTDAIGNFFDILIDIGKFLTGWLITAITNLGTEFNNFMTDGSAAQKLQEFKTALEGVIAVVVLMWSVLAKGDFSDNPFFAEDSKFVQVLFKIRDGILVVMDALKNFGASVKGAGEQSGNFWGGVLGTLQKVWEWIKSTASSIGKFFSSAIDGIDWDAVLAGINAGFLVGAAVAIGKVVRSISGALSSVGNIKDSFIKAIDSVTGAFKRLGEETKAEKLLKIAFAILILAGALYILSTIDPDRLLPAVEAMAAAFLILLGGLKLLDKINAEPSMRLSVAIAMIAFAINIMASAIAKLGGLTPEQLTAGLFAVAALMLLMVMAAERVAAVEGDMLKAAFALNAMALAIQMLVIPVVLLGMLPLETLANGMIAVGVLMLMMTLAAEQLGHASKTMPLAAVALMAMAMALNMLVVPIVTLGLLPFNVLLQGMAALGIALLVMSGIMVGLSYLSPMVAVGSLALVGMALALNMLVVPIVALGLLPFGVLLQGMLALGAALIVMSAIMVGLSFVAPMVAVGALALVAMAVALNLLVAPILILGALPFEFIVNAIMNMTAVLLGLGIMATMMLPFLPIIGLFAIAAGLFGVAMLGLSVGMLLFSVALIALGPALMVATAGLMMFANAAPKIAEAIGPMLGIGIALGVLGVGAALAAIGIGLAALAIMLLGVGLGMIAAVGIIGAFALTKVVQSMMKLMEHVPGMLILGATFTVLGAGVAILGVGLAVLAVAAILVVIAFSSMIPMGALLLASFALITKAIERLVPMADEIAIISKAMGKLGDATVKLAASGRTAANGLNAINTSLITLANSSMIAGNALRILAMTVSVTMAGMRGQLVQGSAGFQRFAVAVLMSIAFMNAGLGTGFAQATAQARGMSGALGGQLVAGIRSSYGPVYNASVTLGSQMTAGMTQGLQNGSWKVSQMASTVAANALTSAKKTLGVASPSKEFEKVGMWSDEGLAKGLLKNMGTVENAAEETGRAALSAVQKSLMAAKNAVATDMTLNPVIMPVLDLSAVQKSASGLNGLLKTPTLTVTDSYAKASYISATRRSDEAQAAEEATDTTGTTVNFTQNNTSPKPLSTSEIYRNSKNAISLIKKEAPV